ncbi:MAG TPA: hypothetical protein VHT91_38820 [Kofleriaceae bacterium]|nr:hypothetical protein [Kofleriaceae bacterium]
MSCNGLKLPSICPFAWSKRTLISPGCALPMAANLESTGRRRRRQPDPTRDPQFDRIASKLIPRDRQVLDDMVAGVSIRQSADRLGVSKSLVHKIRSRIRRELAEARPRLVTGAAHAC